MLSSIPPDILARSVNYPTPQYNPNRRFVQQHPAIHPHHAHAPTRSQATSPLPGPHPSDGPTQNGSHLECYGSHLGGCDRNLGASATANQLPVFSQAPLQPIQPYHVHQLNHCTGCRCTQFNSPNVTILTTSQGKRPCRPPDYTMLAIVTCIFCNICLGAAAIIYSILSNKEADAGNMKAATSKSKVSLALSVIGVFCGVITIVCIICILIVAYNNF